MVNVLLVAVSLLVLACLTGAQYLQVSGQNFILNGKQVYLSGMNIAWYQYGRDFGNGQYDCCTGKTLEEYLRKIHEDGGNSIRKFP